MELFPNLFTIKQAESIRHYIAAHCTITNLKREITTITGADVSYRGNLACAAIVTMSYPRLEVIEQVTAKSDITCPYIPGFLSFREGPPIIKAFHLLKKRPEIMIFDGHGIAHPARAGLATHMGVFLNLPAIGCAKKNLCGTYEEPLTKRGSHSPIIEKDNYIGAAVRTQDTVRPVFVSVGNRINLEKAINIILGASKKYRIPEPIRLADILSRKQINASEYL